RSGTVVTNGGGFSLTDSGALDESAGSIDTTQTSGAGGAVSLIAGGALAVGNVTTSGTTSGAGGAVTLVTTVGGITTASSTTVNTSGAGGNNNAGTVLFESNGTSVALSGSINASPAGVGTGTVNLGLGTNAATKVGAVTQPGGTITATTLNANSSTGGVSLGQSNSISKVGTVVTNGGGFSLTDS